MNGGFAGSSAALSVWLSSTIPNGNPQSAERTPFLRGQPVQPDGLIRLAGIGTGELTVLPAKMVMLEAAAKTFVRTSLTPTVLDRVLPVIGSSTQLTVFMVIDRNACAGDPKTTLPPDLIKATTGPEIVTSLVPGQDVSEYVCTTLVLAAGMGPIIDCRF